MKSSKQLSYIPNELCRACLFALAVILTAGPPTVALEPRLATIQGDALTVAEALTQLFAQTGNRVDDRRQIKKDVKLKLNIEKCSFWPALDIIADAAKCGLSLYQADGQIALADEPRRQSNPVYESIFRTIVKRLGVLRDLETGRHHCVLTLEIAWEPQYEPLYLDIGPLKAIYSADGKGLELQSEMPGQGKTGVAGKTATEVDFRLDAPQRTSLKIKSLGGRFKVIMPEKMLTFVFPELQLGPNHRETKKQDGVSVTTSNVKTTSTRWSVEVSIDNPPGNPAFESYQSWLANNRIALTKEEGAIRRIWTPRFGDEQVEKETATQARIQYSFHIAPKENPGVLGAWTLEYRTPAKIVETVVPFHFRNLELP